ncbi:MAG: PKD domain-containing protein [Candidatus Bathyarchaeia archaeon]
MKRKTLTTLIVMICLCLPLVHIQVKTCTAQGSTFKLVDVLIDYGNGTSRWASCILQPGEDTVYNATQKVVVSLEVSWWGTDAFVEAIDDVRNSYPYYWMWWYWNRYTECWELGPVACNQYVLEDCDMVAWYHEDCSVWPPSPPPNPPATKVDVLLDYGNGTRVSYEDVEVLGFASVLKATKMVASVEYTLWDTNIFVDAINDVWNNYGTYTFWIYWYWNSSAKCWEMGPVACNQYVLAGGDTIAWYYEDCSVWPLNQPLVTMVDILLDYGNGTGVWYENVKLPGVPSVLKATKSIASVEYSLWGTDAFVDAINNVWNDYVNYVFFWMWWYWNHSAKRWELGSVACNKHLLSSGDIIAWYYEDCTTWPPPQPPSTPHPTASFTWTPHTPKVGQTVTFDASASKPNGGTIIDYTWNFGDGSVGYGKMVVHAYNSPGTYTVTLNVTDSNGLWKIEQKQITVVQPHGPKADFKAVPETAKVGEKIKFDASTSLPGWNGTHTMPITEYRWNFGDGNITVTTQPIVYHRYSAAGNYYVTLTVYAPGATPETDSVTVRVTVYAVPVGGQSVSVETPTPIRELVVCLVTVAVIAVAFAVFKRKGR